MANVYSKKLWSDPFTSTTSVLGPTVPAGVVWDVREIDVMNFKDGWQALGFFGLASGTTGYIWYVGGGRARAQQSYGWRGRSILNPGEQLQWGAHDTQWALNVTGYELTLP